MAEIGAITTLFLTTAGKRLQAKVQAGRTKLNLVYAKIGFGYLQDDMNLLELDGPINEVPSHQTGEEGTTATVDITRVYDDANEGMAYIGLAVQNGDNPLFFLREFDIYALDPDVGVICYGIANLGDVAPPIAPYDGRNRINYNYDFPTVIANASDVEANITLAADTPWEDFVRLENVVKGLSAATFFPTNSGVLLNITAEQVALWNNMISMLMKGAANGVAELDANGLVPASQLPSYVDDVLNGTAQGVTETGAGTYSATGFILKGQTALCTPEDDKTYIDTATNIQYRWTGTVFVSMGSNLVLGETSRSAGRGDWTKTAYDHSRAAHAPTTAATQSAMGLMSAADKKRLDEMEDGAQKHKAPTSTEIRSALGYTPADVERLTKIESRLKTLESRALSVESWADIASVSVTTSNTGDLDDCYHFISGSMTTTWGQTITIRTARSGNEMKDAPWGHEQQSTMSAYLDYNGNLYLLYYDTDGNGNDISHPSGTIYVGLAGMGKTETYTRPAPITSDFDD